MKCINAVSYAVAIIACGASLATAADDWPMWRCDAGRTASCDQELGDRCHLQWVRRLPPQRPAWKDEKRLQFDRGYMPVVRRGLMFVGSTVSDTLTAYDLASGAERWRFYCGGPVRPAPLAWRDKVLVASDDGYLYCLTVSDGRVVWKFRGGPRQRYLIGNQRLVSSWPVRCGPVVADGGSTVYFAAGIWPFMGTFVYALDIETGRVVWSNDEASFSYRRMPHPDSEAFSGLSAQGHPAIVGDRLIVPGGDAPPALFDLRNGRLVGYAEGLGPNPVGRGRFGFAGGRMFGLEKGHAVRLKTVWRSSNPVLAEEVWYSGSDVIDPASIKVRSLFIDDRYSDRKIPVLSGTGKKRKGDRGRVWLSAGNRLVMSARKGEIGVIEPSATGKGKWMWTTKIQGEPSCIIAAEGRLLVVTLEGEIRCFGPKEVRVSTYSPAKNTPATRTDLAAEILKTSGVREGYCLVLGLEDRRLIESLISESKLHVVGFDDDADMVSSLRRRLDAAGLYGQRCSVVLDKPQQAVFAPYMASLVFRRGPIGDEKAIGKLFDTLRPYGGTACMVLNEDDRAKLNELVEGAKLPGAEVKQSGKFTLLIRKGPLPGSAPWLGQNADAGATRCSRDKRVAAPLGVLWFGNALSNSLILPRHGEGPVEQVVGGRMFIEGPDSLTACDVYTGRVLWTRKLDGLGKNYISMKHQLGAHSIGSNFFAVSDALYVSLGEDCLVLDPKTGRTKKQLRLPDNSLWQFLLVYEDLLIAGWRPIIDKDQSPKRIYSPTSSKGLIVMNRHTGKVLWRCEADVSFRHYSICAGRGKLFCIDRLSVETLKKLARAGKTPKESPQIVAFDVRTGKIVWKVDKYVGDKLSYSEARDILVANAALRGSDGSMIWYDEEAVDILWGGKWGLMINGDTIYPQIRRAFDLRTGKQRMWQAPSGRETQWRFSRSHGCGPMAGGVNMLTFRSACASYFDLKNDGGTANMGGFRSGCTSNLIIADGVVSAPDYTRGCGCAYQNRSSLGLVHMPDLEYWTFGANPTTGNVAYNFGAPGDRRGSDKALWRATPIGADPDRSNKQLVTTTPVDAWLFYRHALRMDPRDPWRWIGSSGVEGLRRARVPLGGLRAGSELTVRLFFAEPKHASAGKRVFSISLDGKVIAGDLDIYKEAGRAMRTIMKEFAGIRAKADFLELGFTAKAGRPLICGVQVIGAKPDLLPPLPPETQPAAAPQKH